MVARFIQSADYGGGGKLWASNALLYDSTELSAALAPKPYLESSSSSDTPPLFFSAISLNEKSWWKRGTGGGGGQGYRKQSGARESA
jgi:hypothetical protein